MKKKAKKLPVVRNAMLVRAAERSCSAGAGIHKDRRERRKNRRSWRKEYLEDY